MEGFSGIRKFNGTEFEVWSTLTEAVLTARSLYHVLTDARPADDALGKAWDKNDREARALILLSLEPDMVKLVLACATSKEIWDRLKSVHSQRSDACKMVLLKQFYDTKMVPGTTISQYVAETEFIAKKLKDSGVIIDNDTLIGKIVSGLGAEYKHFMSQWMGTAAGDRTLDKLLQRLLAEESVATIAEAGNATAMKAGRMQTSPDKERSKKTIKCYHCGKLGHMKRDCRMLKREQRTEAGNAQSSNSKGQQGYRSFASVASVVSDKSDGSKDGFWLIDSGASFHMSANFEWIQGFKAHDKIPIRVGNNDYLYSTGKGFVDVFAMVDGEQIKITLHDVHYVEGISDNLYSTGAADAKGLKCLLGGGQMRIMSGDKTIMVGNKGNGNLYWLKLQVPIRATVARAERSLEEWHKALGHPSVESVKTLAKKKCAIGFKIVDQPTEKENCGDCSRGKTTHASHPSSSRERSTEVLHRVHTDLVSSDVFSLGGSKYFMLLRDEFSTYMHVYFMAAKSQVVHLLKRYINESSIQAQRRVQIIRADNGSEFANTGVKLLCQLEGIIQEFSAPYCPQQNGQAERANRTIINQARTMLQSSQLPINLWAEAISTAVYLRNRVPNSRTVDKTPFELFFGKEPVLSHLIEFGKQIQVVDSTRNISKYNSRTIDMFMVGYTDKWNTYKCYDPKTNKIILSSDVVIAPHKSSNQRLMPGLVMFTFASSNEEGIDTETNNEKDQQANNNEQVLPSAPSIDLDEPDVRERRQGCTLNMVLPTIPDSPTITETSRPVLQPVVTTRGESRSDNADNPIIVSPQAPTRRLPDLPTPRLVVPLNPIQYSQILRSSSDLIDRSLQTQRSNAGLTQQQPATAVTGTGQHVIASSNASPSSITQRLAPAMDWIMKDRPKRKVKSTYARNVTAICDVEPDSYSAAITSANANDWKAAIKDELNAHDKNGTWQLVPKRAKTKEISAKWVFKVKHNADGSIERHKARLVARGFTQVQGIDYQEVFSPVVRMDSIRLLFSICAQLDLEYLQFDIATAFLNGTIEEDLYMRPPEGLDVPEGFTCKLKKSLYGLRQSPRCWNEKFVDMLKTFRMKQTTSDPCVFVGDGPIYLAIYVDDGIVFARDRSLINELMNYLTKQLDVKIVKSECFIGLEISRNRKQRSIFLHQSAYIKRMLDRYGMQDCKGSHTPLEVGHSLNKKEILDTPVFDEVPYAAAIGSLLYCGLATRPDIAQALSILSKYTSNPREAHWKAVKRVFRYLQSTKDFGLHYQAVKELALVSYTDADWGGDHESRRSMSGMVIFLTTGPISFKAQQQKVVAQSTMEAEYIAASNAVKDLVWLQRFVKELGIQLKDKSQLLCDNQSALKLIKNPEFHQRSKHIDIRYHFIRDEYLNGTFEPLYVSSEQQKADIFTKALTVDTFRGLRDAIGCVSISAFQKRSMK